MDEVEGVDDVDKGDDVDNGDDVGRKEEEKNLTFVTLRYDSQTWTKAQTRALTF